MTHGQDAFDQWYRDTPDVNLPMPYSIILTPTGTPGEVGYANGAFFPIDGQLFGELGDSADDTAGEDPKLDVTPPNVRRLGA